MYVAGLFRGLSSPAAGGISAYSSPKRCCSLLQEGAEAALVPVRIWESLGGYDGSLRPVLYLQPCLTALDGKRLCVWAC